MKNRIQSLTNIFLIGLSGVTLPTISHAAPAAQIIEDVARLGGNRAAYQSNHDSDNAGMWLLLAGLLITICILVGIFKKKR